MSINVVRVSAPQYYSHHIVKPSLWSYGPSTMYAKEQEKLTNFAFCPMYTPFKHEMVSVAVKTNDRIYNFFFFFVINFGLPNYFSAQTQRLWIAEPNDMDRNAKRQRGQQHEHDVRRCIGGGGSRTYAKTFWGWLTMGFYSIIPVILLRYPRVFWEGATITSGRISYVCVRVYMIRLEIKTRFIKMTFVKKKKPQL